MEYSRPLRRTLLINEVHECLQNMYLLNMPSCEVWKTSNKDFAGSKVLEIHFKSFEAGYKNQVFWPIKIQKKGPRLYSQNKSSLRRQFARLYFKDITCNLFGFECKDEYRRGWQTAQRCESLQRQNKVRSVLIHRSLKLLIVDKKSALRRCVLLPPPWPFSAGSHLLWLVFFSWINFTTALVFYLSSYLPPTVYFLSPRLPDNFPLCSRHSPPS